MGRQGTGGEGSGELFAKEDSFGVVVFVAAVFPWCTVPRPRPNKRANERPDGDGDGDGDDDDDNYSVIVNSSVAVFQSWWARQAHFAVSRRWKSAQNNAKRKRKKRKGKSKKSRIGASGYFILLPRLIQSILHPPAWNNSVSASVSGIWEAGPDFRRTEGFNDGTQLTLRMFLLRSLCFSALCLRLVLRRGDATAQERTGRTGRVGRRRDIN